MPRTIAIEIITPERVVFSEQAEIIIVPALDGRLGVLPGHAPLVTGIKIGTVKIRKADGEEMLIPTTGGIMEVRPEQVNIVVNTAELPQEIDVERALRSKERAEKRLNLNEGGLDEIRARASLERAFARLRAAEHLKD